MSKKWTKHQALTGNALSPDSVNDELRAHQSSITTLDRDQLPTDYVNTTRLTDNALHRVWVSDRFPTTADRGGEQTNRDTDTPARTWDAITYQSSAGSWESVGSGTTLTGFKGGNLFIEWSGCGFIYPAFSDTASLDFPNNPKYLKLRILVAGTVVAERRGVSMHEHFRVFGTAQLPAGDHDVQFQFLVTPNGPDDALIDIPGDSVMQAHLYSNKYFAIGRWR